MFGEHEIYFSEHGFIFGELYRLITKNISLVDAISWQGSPNKKGCLEEIPNNQGLDNRKAKGKSQRREKGQSTCYKRRSKRLWKVKSGASNTNNKGSACWTTSAKGTSAMKRRTSKDLLRKWWTIRVRGNIYFFASFITIKHNEIFSSNMYLIS